MATFRANAAALNSENIDSEKEESPKRTVPVCLVRPYKKQDAMHVENLLGDAAMGTVSDYFMHAAFSTLTPQVLQNYSYMQ